MNEVRVPNVDKNLLIDGFRDLTDGHQESG